METSKRTNTSLIAITSIIVIDNYVHVYYAVHPFFARRIAMYETSEIIEQILRNEKQRANSLDFLMMNFNDLLVDEIADFHYAQCSISLRTTINSLKREILYLREKIKKAFTK